MSMNKFFAFVATGFLAATLSLSAADKQIVLVAGKPSHGPGSHEHNAGVQLLENCLGNTPGVKTKIYLNGWPEDETFFDGADAIILYMDGGEGHPLLQEDRLQKMAARMKKGVGLGCIHYAVEPTKQKGENEFLDWIGGAFEVDWSVNPHWTADFKTLPKHPITRGVKPFSINDEWYFHMRFRDGMKGVTPILSAVATDDTMSRPDGTHSGNPAVREAVKNHEPQTVMWAAERAGGGRGFGFSGGHVHTNWGDDNFRKLVLNAILWTAKVEVPKNGVESKVSADDLARNLDAKGGQKKKVENSPAKKKSTPTASAKPASTSRPRYQSGLVTADRRNIDADIAGAKKLWLVVTDGGNGYSCDWSDWTEPRLVRADGTTVNLTTLKWKNATTGWGEIHINQNCSGGPLLIGKKAAPFGIGTHAPSIIEYDLPEAFARFTCKAGLDLGGIEQGGGAQVEFKVYTETPGPDALQSVGGEREIGFDAAVAGLKNFTVADGLEASVFAAEPMLRNPTDIDIDERGRVWACEGVNYRSSFQPWGTLDPKGDRIVILEDTNGDGIADKETTFYQGPEINAALGICVLGNKVIVSRSPDIFVFTDTDGDGKADNKEVLFTGITGVDHDHGAHAFNFGPDGKLYFNMGNAGLQLKRPDGTPVRDIEGREINGHGKPFRNGMVFRCNIDGSDVEVLAHNFRNNYEVAVDSFGTMWQSDNDDDGNRSVRINYVMEHGNFGYSDEMTGAAWPEKRTNLEEETSRRHWHQNDPGVVPNLLITGAGAPTGIAIYEGKLLPQVFRNQMVHCDSGPRIVRSYPVTAEGAGYRADIVDILASSDSWFRPSDVCVAPDGSLLVADWCDGVVGGHNMVDRTVATMTGRVYRVAPHGNRWSVPRNDFTTAKGCVAALASPNNSTRYVAWTKLHELGAKAEKDLQTTWRGNDQRLRARALQLLARIPGKESQYVTQALKDKNADIRIEGLRIARMLKLDLTDVLTHLVRDKNAQVRRECALALQHISSPAAPKLWTELALQYDGRDRWYLEALGIGADAQWDTFLAAWLARVGEGWNTPIGRDILWRSRARITPQYLTKIIADPALAPNDRPRYFRALDFFPADQREKPLVDLLGSLAETTARR